MHVISLISGSQQHSEASLQLPVFQGKLADVDELTIKVLRALVGKGVCVGVSG